MTTPDSTPYDAPHGWETPQFPLDLPLKKLEEDRLNRGRFCQEIADCIAGWKGHESLVLGLNGEWGSGKSTIKSFIIDALEKKTSKPFILEFNPWEWSGQHKLLDGFLWQVGGLFGQKDKAKETEELAKKWEALAATITLGKTVQEAAKPFAPFLTVLFGYPAVMVLLGLFTPWPWPAVGSVGLLLLGLVFQLPAVADQIAKMYRAKAVVQTKSLGQLKAEIRAELGKAGQSPAIIFVDDIDRLTDEEIHLLIQLVKQNCQFPNLIYVLLFQKKTVAKALARLTSDDGDAYLKKIIQVEFDVPLASARQMQNVLTEGLIAILGKRGVAFKWDTDRWNELFPELLWPYFKNLRDVNRFLGAFEFYFNMHINGKVLEVNPVDLIVIEVLRMFDHAAYLEIGPSFFHVTLDMPAAMLGERVDETYAARIDSIASNEARISSRKKCLEDVLHYLFPQAGKNPRGGNEEQWLAGLRACHPRHFEKYFRLALDPGQPSALELSNFLQKIGDRAALVLIFKASIAKEHFDEFLEFIAVSRAQIPKESLETFITALMDVGDSFSTLGNILSGDTNWQCVRVIFNCLKGVERREDVLWKTVNATHGTVLPVMVVASEDAESRKEGSMSDFLLTAEQAARFYPVMVARIKKKAEDETILHFEQCARLLNKWSQWANQEDVNAWVHKVIQKPPFARLLLRRLLSKSITGTTQEFVLHGKYFERFIKIEDLLAAVETDGPQELSPDDRVAIALLKKAVRLKAEGKSIEEVRPPGSRW